MLDAHISAAVRAPNSHHHGVGGMQCQGITRYASSAASLHSSKALSCYPDQYTDWLSQCTVRHLQPNPVHVVQQDFLPSTQAFID